MNKLKNIIYVLGLSLAMIFTGCSDPDDEITSIDYDRLFSPTELKASIVNKTGVRFIWNTVPKAESYNIEVYDNASYEGTPVKSASVTASPSTIDGLIGDTKYWGRIQAVGSDIPDSKWSEVSFTTDINSVLLPIEIGDITTEVFTLRWKPGKNATKILVTPASGKAIEQAVTSAEISAGIAKVSGLTPSTEYTVVLYDGAQRIGLLDIKTLTEGTLFVYPDDDIASMISEAKEGGVFLLMPGTHTVATLNITKSIAIEAASSTDKPILLTTVIRPADGAALALKDLILDGTGSSGDQAIVYAEGEFGALSITGCEIMNYLKGTLYVSKATKIKSVTITNCLYHDIECNGGDFIDFRSGLAETFTFQNNTVYNSALARDLFRMDAGGSTNFPDITSIITIENNTFYKVCDGSSRRILYIRLANHEISFNKNIIAESQGHYTNQNATTIKERSQNNYFNAPNYTASTVVGAQNDTGSYTTVDPQFKDPANGDFTVGNLTLSAGDPRWLQ
ncbi:fibronectin type III domain-containing protein [Dysgonomonas sp. 521]|uniref:DUF4957 domain-containing protein n=1 Tax=Dysgonomonas sp. 521 TaxID=2302932 RepID=UPI0013D881CE|nr:DUF4957 domain-containing protein [Dysgonomonas sp. 521]NDV95899.1 fibronectin type III domain-containing protein [Dysgonomonas sp. 521]